jgi:exodeoxyribonuclease-3
MAADGRNFEPMRVVSWNVNGVRACAKKGFLDVLETCGADVVALQETRVLSEQLDLSLREPEGWHTHFSSAERKGYSGVGLYSRTPPSEVITSLGRPEFDVEGRVQIARFGDVWVANVYFPNGSGKNRDNSRIPYKLDFYRRLYDVLGELGSETESILCVGDFNTAHEEIDLARPKTNHKTSGFCPEERAELGRWLSNGWHDTFRERVPEGEHYTWWSQRFGVRERNIGWRIDYVLASKAANTRVTEAFIWPDTLGSDHCPIGVDLT